MPAKKSPKKEYPVIKGYKAFNKDMTCKEFTYEEGKEYEIKEAIKICVTGFHFCTNPLDCLGYYDLIDSNFHEVESLGETQTHPDDSKVVTNRIKIGAKLDLRAYIKASFDFLWESCNNKEEASGESAQLAASGDSAKLELTGGYSVGAGIGINNKIKAKKGDWITLAEWRYDDNKYIPLCVKSAQVDGTILKEDVWYVLREGEFKEV